MGCYSKSCDRSFSCRWLASVKLVAYRLADQNVAFRTVGGDGNTAIDLIAKLFNTHVRGLSLSFRSDIVLTHATGRVVPMYRDDQDGRARYYHLKGSLISLYTGGMTVSCAETAPTVDYDTCHRFDRRARLRWTAALVDCLEVRQGPAHQEYAQAYTTCQRGTPETGSMFCKLLLADPYGDLICEIRAPFAQQYFGHLHCGLTTALIVCWLKYHRIVGSPVPR